MGWSWCQPEVRTRLGKLQTLDRRKTPLAGACRGLGWEGPGPGRAWALTQHVEAVEGAHGFTERGAVGPAGDPVAVVSG